MKNAVFTDLYNSFRLLFRLTRTGRVYTAFCPEFVENVSVSDEIAVSDESVSTFNQTLSHINAQDIVSNGTFTLVVYQYDQQAEYGGNYMSLVYKVEPHS